MNRLGSSKGKNKVQEVSSEGKNKSQKTTYIRAGSVRSYTNKQKSLLSQQRSTGHFSNLIGGVPNVGVGHTQKKLVGTLAESEQQLDIPTSSARAEEEHVQQESTTHTIDEQCQEQGTSKKKHRGPTQMQSVHARIEHKRTVLNDKGQRIGPTRKDTSEYGSFLGTLGRNPTLCPLDLSDWRKMDTKDDLWECVQEKYDIPDAGRKWSMRAIGDSWKNYRYKLKRDHFDDFENDERRMENRPENVPESVFKGLLEHWNSDKAKERSKNRKS